MLTELRVKAAKAKEKSYMLRDDKGLYLRVDPSGRKYWILRYWENSKEHELSLSPYPDLSLKDARLKRDEIQTARAKGENPSQKAAGIPQNFTHVTREWLKIRMADKDETYIRKIHFRLNKYIPPAIGALSLKEITSVNILRICRQRADISPSWRIKAET